MIEVLREWKHSWSGAAETIIGFVIFLGGYTFLQIVGAKIAEHFDNKEQDQEGK